MQLGSDVAVTVGSLADVAPIRPLAWETPCAMRAALKKQKKKSHKWTYLLMKCSN